MSIKQKGFSLTLTKLMFFITWWNLNVMAIYDRHQANASKRRKLLDDVNVNSAFFPGPWHHNDLTLMSTLPFFPDHDITMIFIKKWTATRIIASSKVFARKKWPIQKLTFSLPFNNWWWLLCNVPCLYEPRHDKTCFCHMRTTKMQISLRICAVWSASLLFAA